MIDLTNTCVLVRTKEENEMLLKEAEKQGFHWYSKGNCKPLPGQHFPDILKFCNNKDVVHSVRIGVKKGTWYVTIRAWNQTSKDKSRVYNPYSAMKKFKTKK